MYSMTGYGKGKASVNGKEVSIEIKSVNHRFLDINTKLPKLFIQVEDVLRKTIQSELSRGRVDVFVTYTDKSDEAKEVFFDLGLAKAYVDISKKIEIEFGVKDDLSTTAIMKIPDVVKQESKEEEREFLADIVKRAVLEALSNLNKMREIEGEKLKEDILNRVEILKNCLGKIEEKAPLVAKAHGIKVRERVETVLAEVEIDQNKLVNEVAFYADKCNIDEEITRLKSHFIQCENILSKEKLVGRKLDFLIQEFNRETNTICSKSNDVELTNVALEMKSEIEKIREQVQNLE